MGQLILAIDQGTTGTTVLIVDDAGAVRGRGYATIPQHYPQPGWVEHDPRDLWQSVREAAAQALAAAGAAGRDLAAIGITNQRETALLWERATGRPVHRAIVWQCRRTAPRCEGLRAEGAEAEVRRRTGLVLDPYFSGTKLEWLLDAEPDRRRRAERGELAFGTVDSWLVWQLSGGAAHVTDASNASRTLLLNLGRAAWDEAMLDLLHVPAAVLPRVVPSSGPVAETIADDPFPAGLPIAGIAGDQQAALFGQGCGEPGMAKNTYGTGCFLLVQAGETAPAPGEGLLATIAWQRDGRTSYALEGSVFVAGAAVQWLRDEMGLIAAAEESEALARSVPDTAGVVIVPAFVGLGAPYWEAEARGTIVGLTRGAGRAHLARAVLESIAHQVTDVMEAMARSSGLAIRELRVDGGASANDFLMQFQADLLGVPLVRPRSLETTALGAAYLAGLGVGLWRPEDIATWQQPDRTFTPGASGAARAGRRAEWRRAVACARVWAEGTNDVRG
jgi:glycerol kinase